jgi:hypothetical protein
MKAEKVIYIEARDWFDKANGNSYYSARCYVDGKHAFTTGLCYGYEFTYEYHVMDELVYYGYLPESMSGRGVRWAKDLGLIVHSVKYSARKRELWPADYSEAGTA